MRTLSANVPPKMADGSFLILLRTVIDTSSCSETTVSVKHTTCTRRPLLSTSHLLPHPPNTHTIILTCHPNTSKSLLRSGRAVRTLLAQAKAAISRIYKNTSPKNKTALNFSTTFANKSSPSPSHLKTRLNHQLCQQPPMKHAVLSM